MTLSVLTLLTVLYAGVTLTSAGRNIQCYTVLHISLTWVLVFSNVIFRSLYYITLTFLL